MIHATPGTDFNAAPGSSLDESFCIVDRDAAATVPSAPPTDHGSMPMSPASGPSAPVPGNAGAGGVPVSNTAVPNTASTGPVEPPMHPHHQPYPMTPSQGQVSTPSFSTLSSAGTPQRYDAGPGAPPASASGLAIAPPTGPHTGGQRMSALRAKPHSELPSALSTPSAGGYGQASGYGAAPQPFAPAGVHSPPVHSHGDAHGTFAARPAQYGFDTSSLSPSSGSGLDQHHFASAGNQESGLWGWVQSTTSTVMESASRMVNNPDMLMEGAQRLGRNIVDKTKNSMDNVLTTLDPGMAGGAQEGSRQSVNDMSTPGAAYIQSKKLVLTSTKLPKIEAIQTGFKRCFQAVQVRGFVCPNGIAPQPLGLQACVNGAQQRIQYLRSMHSAALSDAVLIGMETCIAELLPGCFFDIACLVLHDPAREIILQALTQPVALPNHIAETLKASNPPNYAQADTGFATRWPSVVAKEIPGVDPADPHRALAGLSRFRLLETAASTLAKAYDLQLQRFTSPLASSQPAVQQHPPPPMAGHGGMYPSVNASSTAPPPPPPTASQQHSTTPGKLDSLPAGTGQVPVHAAPPPDMRSVVQSPYQQQQQQPQQAAGGALVQVNTPAPAQMPGNLFQ